MLDDDGLLFEIANCFIFIIVVLFDVYFTIVCEYLWLVNCAPTVWLGVMKLQINMLQLLCGNAFFTIQI